MIKVLIIHSTTQAGGLSKVMYNICAGLQGKGVNYTLLLLSPQPKQPTDEWFKAVGVNVIQAPEKLGFVDTLHFVWDVMSDVKPNLIHTHGLRGCVFANVCGNEIPHISTLHGKMLTNYCHDFGKLKGVVSAIIHSIAFAGASVQTLVSSTLLKHVFVNKHAKVICNGVDLTRFCKVSNEQKSLLRSQFQIPAEAKVLVYFGNISKLKSVFTLLEAFELIQQKHPSAILYFLGAGEYLEQLKERAKQNTQVMVLGYQENIAPWLQASDVYVSPSLSEGLPNAALEALGCGLSMVLSDIPPHREVEVITGAHIHFFETKNIQKLSGVLDDVLQKPFVLQTASSIGIEKMAADYFELYQTVANK